VLEVLSKSRYVIMCIMRKHGTFSEGEYYHIYNRGVEKRDITMDWKDSERFLQSLIEFNTIKPIGSIYQNSFRNDIALLSARSTKLDERLVDIVAYCLNPNHYHLILTPLVDGGIEKFMQKFGAGYTRYFNEKYNRSGGLFQGKFKSSHINSNTYLLHVAAYVNLNDKVHQLSASSTKLVRSSWLEYLGNVKSGKEICNTDMMLGQFKNGKEYEISARESLQYILENRYSEDMLVGDLLAREEYPGRFEKKDGFFEGKRVT